MRKESLEFEANKIHEQNPTFSSVDCWSLAERNLSIFRPDIYLNKHGNYVYCPNRIGAYGLFANNINIQWESCRELFEKNVHYRWAVTKKDKDAGCDCSYFLFWFDHSSDCTECVANFIRETEYRLNLIHLTKFQKSNTRNCLVITPSDFWKDGTMRLSLLTILCRCGIIYNGSNYDTCLSSNEYSQKTINAVQAFLSGQTKFIGSHDWLQRRNWVYTFSDKTRSEVDQLLIA